MNIDLKHEHIWKKQSKSYCQAFSQEYIKRTKLKLTINLMNILPLQELPWNVSINRKLYNLIHKKLKSTITAENYEMCQLQNKWKKELFKPIYNYRNIIDRKQFKLL